MRLFLDSADLADWKALLPTGLFFGVTTNPTLARRAGHTYADMPWEALAETAASLGGRELHGQVFGAPGSYVAFATRLYAAARAAGIETVVKIPLTEAGIRATPAIRDLGGRFLMTACYHAKQMLAAQALGAHYIAPYVGRMSDAGLEPLAHLRRMAAVRAQDPAGPAIMAASIRSADQLLEIAACGVDTATISPAVARELLNEPLTDAALAAFELDASSGS